MRIFWQLWRKASRFIVYAVFILSLIALVVCISKNGAGLIGLRGQEVEGNPFVACLVYLVIALVSGIGCVKAVRRDVRFCRQKKNRATKSESPQPSNDS